ncbi:DUF6233 domain-containing protein [Streptomyces sp. NPDC046881]|uniref:DUF6233 domain-containing protein n=1 Tax=Streptomyces sp. NPDC046881 TaxID=3155374 RepID=UPI0033E4300B
MHWFLELGLNRGSAPMYVHTGGCWNVPKRSRGVRSTPMSRRGKGCAMQRTASRIEYSKTGVRRWSKVSHGR